MRTSTRVPKHHLITKPSFVYSLSLSNTKMRSNYKTTECRYFKQNRCTRGDQCTFRHGPDDPKAVTVPAPSSYNTTTTTIQDDEADEKAASQYDEYNEYLAELDEQIQRVRAPAVAWTPGPPHPVLTIHTTVDYSCRRYQYYIQGPNHEECLRYYEDTILAQYPSNPYFTRIHSEGHNFLHVTRSTTSD